MTKNYLQEAAVKEWTANLSATKNGQQKTNENVTPSYRVKTRLNFETRNDPNGFSSEARNDPNGFSSLTPKYWSSILGQTTF